MTQDLLHFFSEHYVLSLAMIIIVLLIFFEELKSKSSGNNLSPTDATMLINREHAVVIDIREHDAFNAGHIVNAIHIPHDEVLTSDKLKKLQAKPLILVCKQSHTANTTASKLRKQDFKNVYVLKGGLDAWKEAGLPVVKS